MKKVFSVLLISLFIGFVGCSDDDDNKDTNVKSSLEGSVWIENKESSRKSEIKFYKNTCDIKAYYEICDMGGCRWSEGTFNFSYEVKNSNIEFSPTDEKSENSVAHLENDKITFSSTVDGEVRTREFIRK